MVVGTRVSVGLARQTIFTVQLCICPFFPFPLRVAPSAVVVYGAKLLLCSRAAASLENDYELNVERVGLDLVPMTGCFVLHL